jgi:hypothetical protein
MRPSHATVDGTTFGSLALGILLVASNKASRDTTRELVVNVARVIGKPSINQKYFGRILAKQKFGNERSDAQKSIGERKANIN